MVTNLKCYILLARYGSDAKAHRSGQTEGYSSGQIQINAYPIYTSKETDPVIGTVHTVGSEMSPDLY